MTKAAAPALKETILHTVSGEKYPYFEGYTWVWIDSYEALSRENKAFSDPEMAVLEDPDRYDELLLALRNRENETFLIAHITPSQRHQNIYYPDNISVPFGEVVNLSHIVKEVAQKFAPHMYMYVTPLATFEDGWHEYARMDAHHAIHTENGIIHNSTGPAIKLYDLRSSSYFVEGTEVSEEEFMEWQKDNNIVPIPGI